MAQIFVDADACPVVRIVEQIAEKHSIPVTLPIFNTNLSTIFADIIITGTFFA